MLTESELVGARERTVGFFRSVTLGARVASPRVDAFVGSDDEARRAQSRSTSARESMSFLDLKGQALSRYEREVSALSRADLARVREFADAAADECLRSVAPEGVFEDWLEDLTSDAEGVFYSELFPRVVPSKEFFELIKDGYRSGGVPCGFSRWPASSVLVFAPA